MKRILCAGALMLILGCTPGETESRPMIDRDTLTRRQKDSIISTLPLPGARGVGAALRATDRVKERADRHDSLLGGRK
ncbi:MAG: hypothetical protein BMS9Abin29_2103 [Gemmatimonadota bacterium]|nr:MAG: hypothetical protein BMS9Abin29_2103 [Gemmatimonadota bacterium]